MNAGEAFAIFLEHLIPALQNTRGAIKARLADESALQGRHVFSPAEAAEYLRISESQLHILTERGDIPCHRVSERITRYSERSLLAWIEGENEPDAKERRLA